MPVTHVMLTIIVRNGLANERTMEYKSAAKGLKEVNEADLFPFIGRVSQMALCVRLLRKAYQIEEPLRISVIGERGIGKTRFMREMAKKAQAFGYKVLIHHCQKWDRYHPYSTMSAFLRTLFRKPPDWTPRGIESMHKIISEELPGLELDRDEEELVLWLFGSTSVSDRILDLDKRSRKGILTTLFRKAIEQELQRRAYILIAIDDIYHSDEFSRDYLLNTVFDRRIAIAFSTLSSTLSYSTDETKEVRLPALSEGEIERFLAVRFSRDFPSKHFASKLMTATQGNALHLVQLLSQIPADKNAPERLSELLEQKRPSEVLGAALHRLGSLDASSTRLIKCASVIADSFPLAILRQMVGQRIPMKTVLRTLRNRRLAWVKSSKGKHFFHFEHGIVKEAVYSLLDEVEKENLHADAAKALEHYHGKRAERHLMSIAQHYRDAGDRESAAKNYFQAGKYFFHVGDYPSAEEAFSEAEELFEDTDNKHKAMGNLITVLQVESKIEECLKLSRSFLRSSPKPDLKAQVLLTLASLHTISGSLHKVIESAKKSAEFAKQCGKTKLVSKAYSYISSSLAKMGRIKEAREYGWLAHETAYKTGKASIIGDALSSLAAIELFSGNPQEGKRLFELAKEQYEKTGNLLDIANVTANIGAACAHIGEFHEAIQKSLETAELFEKIGASRSAGLQKYNAAASLFETGEYELGLPFLEEALKLLQSAKSLSGFGQALIVKALYLIKMGKIKESLPTLEKGWEILEREGRQLMKNYVVSAHVECAILLNNMEKALKESKDFLEESSSSEIKDHYHSALVTRMDALLAASKLNEAAEVAVQIEKLPPEENPLLAGLIKTRLSRLAAMRGEFQKAQDLLQQALATGRLQREARAQTLCALGEALLAAGELPQARQYLEKAKEEYSSLVHMGYRKNELTKVEQLLRSFPSSQPPG